MLVKQISSMLNSVFGEVLGTENLIAEDLSNVVSAGRIITGSSTFDDNFDNYAKSIIDKVGRTVFWDRVYKAQDLGLWRDSWEYASVLEKIRCEVGEYEDNCEWDLTKDADSDGELDYNENISTHIAEMFKFYPAKIQSKYFNAKTTFKVTISITRKQLRSAFDSASNLSRFIGMIEQRVLSKLEISKNQLQKMTVANLIGEHIAQGKQVIDLAALYTAETGAAAGTFQNALSDGKKARFIAQKITFFREMMTEPSKLYSATGTFYNHTPVEDSRLIVLADLDSALKFNVYGDTYNEEFVKLENYKMVPFWQSSGKSIGDSLGIRSGINITTSNRNVVSRNAIIGVLIDRDAAMIANEEPEVRTQYNPDGNFTNFMYCTDCSYYNDFDENAIIFVWGGNTNIQPALTAGATSGTTIVTAASVTVPAGSTAYSKAGTDIQSVTIGDTFTTTGWTSTTPGTTEISVTEGQYLTVVLVNSSGVATSVGAVEVKAEDIGS